MKTNIFASVTWFCKYKDKTQQELQKLRWTCKLYYDFQGGGKHYQFFSLDLNYQTPYNIFEAGAKIKCFIHG